MTSPGVAYPGAMIGRLRGLLIQKLPNQALVECGGVGYVCAISLGTYGMLPEPGAEVILQVETLLRENDLSLLGFATTMERELYRMLVKVDGIGPKLALAALGALPLDELVGAIRARDVKTLTRIPGIGKKSAEKICFELSEKLGGPGGLEGLGASTEPRDRWESDLRSALTNLGFREDAVAPVVAELKLQKPPLAEAIRLALKALQR
jgi:Holliday junction DNA helicase RuvA